MKKEKEEVDPENTPEALEARRAHLKVFQLGDKGDELL